MRVRVLYFGVLKDVLGRELEEVELLEGSSVAALVDSLKGRPRAVDGLWETIAIAVNREYVRGAVVLRDGDEVALLPPVSGGGR